MTARGLPHSEILGSSLVSSSPKLIAACYVLHRRSAPRHPPLTLSSLTTQTRNTCVFSFGLTLLSCQRTHSRSRRTSARLDREASRGPTRVGGADRTRTDDLRLARAALSQLSYCPVVERPACLMVGLSGLEPLTSRLSGVRSNQLSYRPNQRTRGVR